MSLVRYSLAFSLCFAAAPALVVSAQEEPGPGAVADRLIAGGRVQEAVAELQSALAANPSWAAGHARLGAVSLLQGDEDAARAHFGRGLEVATSTSDRLDLRHWIAASYLYENNYSRAIYEFGEIAKLAEQLGASEAERALPLLREAAVEALYGERRNAPARFARAAEIDPAGFRQRLTYEVVGFSVDPRNAGKPLLAYAADVTEPADSLTLHTLNGLLALSAGQIEPATIALEQAARGDLLAQALHAEVYKVTRDQAAARRLRDEVLAASVKEDDSHRVDFFKVIARLRAEKL